jgi:hypothetical protein
MRTISLAHVIEHITSTVTTTQFLITAKKSKLREDTFVDHSLRYLSGLLSEEMKPTAL